MVKGLLICTLVIHCTFGFPVGGRFRSVVMRGSGKHPPLSRLPAVIDAKMTDCLDDIIFGGDIQGAIQRRAKDALTDDFLDFVEEQIQTSQDADMKLILTEISSIINSKLELNEGMADAGEVFEKRLNKILFTAPAKRKDFIEANRQEMTVGFIDYVQKEMKAADDMDSKVVIASVLQMIGQVKDTDLLGNDASVLQYGGDSSAHSGLNLSGGANTDDLQREVTDSEQTKLRDRNEQVLAGLMFSINDIMEDILNNLHEINGDFVGYLERKIDSCRDMEERVGLSSLRDTISAVLEKVREAEGRQGEQWDSGDQEELSIEQVKLRMKEIQTGRDLAAEQASGKRKYAEFSVQADQRQSFLAVLQRFQNLPANFTLQEAVEQNYHLCDYSFMHMLQGEIDDCLQQAAEVEAEQYVLLQNTINAEMAHRVGTAQVKLDKVLKRGRPVLMEAEIGMMVRRGEVDEALMLLIEANVQQARSAGPAGAAAAEVLSKLIKRINIERDRIQPEGQRLLKALLRMDDSAARKDLLYDTFRPAKVQNAEGDWVDGTPDITPPVFINLVRNLIENLGNVDTFDIISKAVQIIDEAQGVATELYGEGMTPQQQQRFMFEKKTMSVWDLANFEEQALMSGEDIPWRNDKYDEMKPEEVVGERVRKIGGN